MRDIGTTRYTGTSTGSAPARSAAVVSTSVLASVVLVSVVLTAVVLAGCSGGGEGAKPTPNEGPMPPIRTAQPMHVFASRTFRPLMSHLEPMFERDHPEFDLVVTFGVAHAPLDADQNLQEMISDGAQLDVFLAGDAIQVSQISREPTAVVPWVGNRLVLVRPRGSGLRLIDLSSGNCEVAVALERTPLGRASRKMLEARGIWSQLTERVGLFDDAKAIMTRVASPGLEPTIGVAYASSVRMGDEPIEIAAVLDGVGGGIEHVVAVWSSDGGVFSAWLGTPAVQDIARQTGFVTLGAAGGESGAEAQGRP